MKVQLIYANTVRHPSDISIGIGIISSVLKRANHDVDLIDTTFTTNEQDILNQVKNFKPDLIGFTALSNSISYATHIAELIKRNFNIPIIIGGVYPTIAPDEVISNECFDMICMGEGENAILELTASMEKNEKNTAIKNIWFKDNGKVIKNCLGPLTQDLDSLPDFDFEIFDYPRYLKMHNMTGSFLSSRGCPFKCTYCVDATNQKLFKGLGSYVRYRSIDRVIDEIKNAIDKYGIENIEFYDDTFTLKRARVKEFCEKYKKAIKIPFQINARIDLITEDMCRDLQSANCRRVSIGLESGQQHIREEVLNRKISDETIIKGCQLIKKYNIELYTYNMIGIPNENINDIKKTIKLNQVIKPDFVGVSIFTAYKGTALYDQCKQQGLLEENRPIFSYLNTSNVKHPSLSIRKLMQIRRWFGFLVFIKYNPKRAVVELIDRHLITTKYYTRIRSFLIMKLRH